MNFLKEVASIYLSNHIDEIDRYCFVFPNRRSSLFFLRYLSQLTDTPFFSPKVKTIQELFAELSGLMSVDKIKALYILYGQYIVKSGSKETFDDFVNWGDVILNDFDDIDKYLVDAKGLFTNIKELKEIDSGFDYLTQNQIEAIKQFWQNFIPYKGNRNEEFFLSLWNILYDLYIGFRYQLSESSMGYEGMQYRIVADRILNGEMDPAAQLPYKKVVFVGLNALNRCEKVLLERLLKDGVADCYWDYYGEILTDSNNRSSLFMADNIADYPSKYNMFRSIVQDEKRKKIEVISVPSAVGQTRVVRELLHSLATQDNSFTMDQFNTSIVLPDERLLIPLLNSIPGFIEKVNVTMGYPLSYSSISSIMNRIASLQTRSRIIRGTLHFYHVDVISILEHPELKSVFGETVKGLRDEIINTNLVYIPINTINRYDQANLAPVFKNVIDTRGASIEQTDTLSDYLKKIIELVQEYMDGINKEFAYHYYRVINRIGDLKIPLQAKTYFRLIRSLVSSQTIPFEGEPLAGLQIMGPLETRALDFDNVIILSANEGVFPSRSVSNTLIPYNLRIGFGLPSYEYMDSISSYHFYRSIYRAKRVYMIYDSTSEGLTTGEMSRFILQMKYNYHLDITNKVVSYPLVKEDRRIRPVIKTPELMEKIESLLSNEFPFSASSVNFYLDCNKKFFYRYIEKLKEKDVIKEEVEPDTFGNIFHKTMEFIYAGFVSKMVEREELEALLADKRKIRDSIDKIFRTQLMIDKITGKNEIIASLIMRYVEKVLEYDISITPFKYIGSEVFLEGSIELKDGRCVRLRGYADRVDLVAGKYRYIDYKTGNIETKYRELEDIFDNSIENRAYTTLQLLFYLLLSGQRVEECTAVVYSLKDLIQGKENSIEVGEIEIELFREGLIRVIEEILDPERPFNAVENEKRCEYCPFKEICA